MKRWKKKFEAKYPDIDLRINSYLKAGENMDGAAYEKFKKMTNTAVLAGKGGDIIEASALPVNDYIDKKLLLDMDDYISKDNGLDKNDFQMNVLESLKLKGGLYTIPEGYSMRVFIGDGDVIGDQKLNDKEWNWKEFADASKELLAKVGQSGSSARYALANDPPEVVLQWIVMDSYGAWVDAAGKKASFDSPEFINLMEEIKKMYNEGIITSKPAEMGQQLFYTTVLRSPGDFIEGLHAYFKNPKLLTMPHNGPASGNRIIPNSQFVIQAKSPVKEEALKFISFLLSEEGQSIEGRSGLSFLQSVNYNKLDGIQEQVKSGGYKLPDGQSVQVGDDDFDQFKDVLKQGGSFDDLDVQVIKSVWEESTQYFNGQKPAADVAKLIQNRTSLYLNE